MADLNAAADATDTAIKTGGGGALGALIYWAVQKGMEKLGSGPGTERAKEAEEREVQQIQSEVRGVKADVEGVKKELGEIRTALALAAQQGAANRDGLAELKGAFNSLSSSVQMTMNSVQSELARIAGYMQAQSEQPYVRRAMDPTPVPRYIPPTERP